MGLFRILFWISSIAIFADVMRYNNIWMFLGNIIALILSLGVLRSLYYKPKHPIDGSSLFAKLKDENNSRRSIRSIAKRIS